MAGVVPVTAGDFPGRIAATVFLAGCNFRCPFCHNPELVAGPFPCAMTLEELGEWLGQRRGFLDGLCISGGEPLLGPKRVVEIARQAKAAGFAVKLDTNGSLPDRLARLFDAGLVDYVALDVKASPARYAEAAGREVDPRRIKTTVELLRRWGGGHELRTTILPRLHTAREIEALGHWVGGASTYIIQPFYPTRTLAPNWRAEPSPTPEVLGELAERARAYFASVIVSF
ncbi:MAG: anaerobic ribonucleoside-triphosphate reductase activating protein [Armatimonadetes bacterium]|nr:anaerobic ribonucleoside-triphosphate reductase activating protein [Armatimonadota bacterium]